MDKTSAFKVFSRGSSSSNPWLDVWQASVLGLVKEPGPRRAQACGGPDSAELLACCRSGQSISRAYDNRTMMPLAPTPIVPVPSKPKIGFSIDSIVGGGGQGRDDRLDRLERVEIERDDGSPMDVVEGSSSPRARRVATRSPGAHSEGSDRPVSRSSSVESYPNSRRTPSHPGTHHHHHANHHANHHHHLSAATHLDFGRATVHSHSGRDRGRCRRRAIEVPLRAARPRAGRAPNRANGVPYATAVSPCREFGGGPTFPGCQSSGGPPGASWRVAPRPTTRPVSPWRCAWRAPSAAASSSAAQGQLSALPLAPLQARKDLPSQISRRYVYLPFSFLLFFVPFEGGEGGRRWGGRGG